MTRVLELDPEHPQKDALELAASIIVGGGLVAFPTETVYGLGADAMNEDADLPIKFAEGIDALIVKGPGARPWMKPLCGSRRWSWPCAASSKGTATRAEATYRPLSQCAILALVLLPSSRPQKG